MATTEHNGRKITAVARRKDGFPGVLVKVNGVQAWHYGWANSATLRTVEGAIEQTKIEIDAVDAFTDDTEDPRFTANWYRKDDPRRAVAIRLGRTGA